MNYEKELSYIRENVKSAYDLYANTSIKEIHQKSSFDIVTNTDLNIEQYIINKITSSFPSDNILSEEYNSGNGINGRTWIIDPIDGTCNFAQNIPLFGIQCALVDNYKVVLSYIYLPLLDEEYYATIGDGAWKNGIRINIKTNCLNNAIVSFGDYPHTSSDYSIAQQRAISNVVGKIAKIRMFGAACIDFSYVASGKTNGCVLITSNLWDLLPGIFLCQEAGAVITNLKGEKYKFYDEGVIIAADETLQNILIESFKRD